MSNNISEVCEKVLYSEEVIAQRCTEIGKQISEDYAGGEVTLISILNGSFMFSSDLIKNITIECRIDFMQVSTYGNSSTTSGNFVIKKDITIDVTGKNVIIIEDILDTGYTMKNLIEYFKIKNVKTLKIATMIDKPKRRRENITADYVGFTMTDDSFIVGYGLDYAQKYRNLPYIGVLSDHLHA